jgi:hypothetical protein
MLTTAIAWLDPTSIPRNDFFLKRIWQKDDCFFFWVCFYYIKFVPFERLDLNRHLCSDGEMMM